MSLPNPVRPVILAVGLGLARAGLVDRERARRTVDLAWPRVVTRLARTSKSAADVAMVGIALGPAAIAGLSFATPYGGLAFTAGAGLAAGTIALVSQRFGAGRQPRVSARTSAPGGLTWRLDGIHRLTAVLDRFP